MKRVCETVLIIDLYSDSYSRDLQKGKSQELGVFGDYLKY
jgi:hypothetical protein